jgi:hypothetical protein
VINEHCPHCEKDCVSNFRKLFLVPGTTATCRSCGEFVSVPFYALVSAFPLLMAYMIIVHAPEGALGMRMAIAGVLIGFAAYYQIYLLPLVAR